MKLKVDKVLALAEHLEKISPKKFNLNEWADPDPTCKTAACIAGWATILFAPKKYQDWEKAKYAKDKTEADYYSADKEGEDNYEKVANSRRLVDRLTPDWFEIAGTALGLDHKMARALFYPNGDLWTYTVTNKDAALALRVLAKLGTLPQKKGWIWSGSWDEEWKTERFDRRKFRALLKD